MLAPISWPAALYHLAYLTKRNRYFTKTIPRSKFKSHKCQLSNKSSLKRGRAQRHAVYQRALCAKVFETAQKSQNKAYRGVQPKRELLTPFQAIVLGVFDAENRTKRQLFLTICREIWELMPDFAACFQRSQL